MATLKMQAEIVAKLLESNNREHSANVIRNLLQQRAELMQALKLIIGKYEESEDMGDLSYWPFEDAKSLISTME